MAASGEPFVCPSCGGGEWKADYYEAVWQSISLDTGEDGEPVFGDYTGSTGTYDDGSTGDECYRCTSCDYTIQHGQYVFVPEPLVPDVLAFMAKKDIDRFSES